MKKMIEECISKLNNLKMVYENSTSNEEFVDGCNCAIDCINDGLDARISILRELENDEAVTLNIIQSFFTEFSANLITTLKSCMRGDSSLFSQGFNKTIIDFCEKTKQ
jgi:hypothetical protein